MENMFALGLSAEEVVVADDIEIVQTVAMAITLFLELWALLPYLPQAQPEQRLRWADAAREEARKCGASFPLPGKDAREVR